MACRQLFKVHGQAKLLYLDSAVSFRVDDVIGVDLSVTHIIGVQGAESFRHLVQGVLAEVLRVGLDAVDGDISRDDILQDASLLNSLKDQINLVVPFVNVNAIDQLFACEVSQHFCIVDRLGLLFLFSVLAELLHHVRLVIDNGAYFKDLAEASLMAFANQSIIVCYKILFYSHGTICVDFFIRVLPTLDALHHLSNGHVEAQERVVLDQIVLVLDCDRQGSRQALPLDVMRFRVVQQFNLNVLRLVQCVLEHVMGIINPRRTALKKCEVRDARDFLRIVSLLVENRRLHGGNFSFLTLEVRLRLRQ